MFPLYIGFSFSLVVQAIIKKLIQNIASETNQNFRIYSFHEQAEMAKIFCDVASPVTEQHFWNILLVTQVTCLW